MNTQPTPKTDKNTYNRHQDSCPQDVVPALICRRLERELAEARAESIRWMSIAEGRGRTDDEGESDCSVCGGCFMILGPEPNDDVMNTPCPKCNEHSKDTGKAMSNLIRERDEAREYADKLAEGLPEGMLPKDVEVLREANLGLATELTAVTAQRDRLAEALERIANNNIQDSPETNYAYQFGRMEGIAKTTLQSLTPNAEP
jgi:hypothetical protein